MLIKVLLIKKIRVYRDDGLAVLKNASRPASEKRTQLQSIIECNLKIANYFDVTFNVNDGSYQLYRKPNDETCYIHVQSEHPPSTTKDLSRSIEKRLSQLPSLRNIFYETTPY